MTESASKRKTLFRKKALRFVFHGLAFILVFGAILAAIVNKGLGWSPSPDLVSNQFYDATILKFVKHLVDNPQVKLPFLAYEGAVWLKSTTAAHVLWSLVSLYFGIMLPRYLETIVREDTFIRVNKIILLSTLPALLVSVVLHVFITPIPPPPSTLRHGDWFSAYFQRMLPAFLVGWSVSIDQRSDQK